MTGGHGHIDPGDILRAARNAVGAHMRTRGLRDDLHDSAHSDAVLGAYIAAQRWDPDKGPAEPYMRTRALYAILDGIRDQSHKTRRELAAKVHDTDLPQSRLPPVPIPVLQESGEDARMSDPDAVGVLEHVERTRDLDALLSHLDDRERFVVEAYDLRGWRLKEIGDSLEVSESRVSQIRSAALRKMRKRGPQRHGTGG